ncbi:MAG: oxidoreductase [Deltaproteobacteria bacterium RIFCSPLOWO2_02_FULL_47_10]|nr:MAG: oxidoreductase [Deltaproteobacteria bacterium RIFCSPLOWO2_02_FULL_47_10]
MSWLHNMESLYLPNPAKIRRVEQLTSTEKLFEIELEGKKPLGHKPGQFVEISVFGVGEAPISVSSSPTRGNGSFELAIRKVGNVTGALHNMKVGDKVGIRGPFGTSFLTDEAKGRDLLIVAGGIGLVPARSFINYAIDNKKKYGRITVLFGAKSPAERLFLKELAQWREQIELHETVDRFDCSWKGNTGVITTLFPKITIDPKKTFAIIVGPPIMYKFVLIECKKRAIPDQQIIMSLERRMKCGVGKCGHCQMNGVYVCQKGPVFRYSDIKEIKEAL